MTGTKRQRWQRVRAWWSDYSWLILLCLGLTGLILGHLGFTFHAASQEVKRTFFDNLYLTLGLLSLNSGGVDGHVRWQLHVAGFLVQTVAA